MYGVVLCVQADQVMGAREGTQPGRLSSGEVELEASATLSQQPDSGIFQGFAGCIKAEMQWLPLQWTYLARGVCPDAWAPPCMHAPTCALVAIACFSAKCHHSVANI